MLKLANGSSVKIPSADMEPIFRARSVDDAVEYLRTFILGSLAHLPCIQSWLGLLG